LNSKSIHDASASVAGYLFQCRHALYEGIRAIADFPERSISIEKFDDIAFDTAGTLADLIQTKHHVSKAGSLTDASIDLWKTLRIWSARVSEDSQVPFQTRFTLLTTSTAPDGSAASLLRARDRNEEEAEKILSKTATTSTNKENLEAYKSFTALSAEQRVNMLKAVIVLDRSPNVIDLHEEICRELRHAVSREHVEHFVERLEGWWFNIVVNAIAGNGNSIAVLAIDNRIDELRQEFQRAALPVDFADADPPADVVAELDGRPFVQNLREIKIGPQRIEYAIRDFYRASEQRSKWLREDLLVDGEIPKYERQLKEAWEPRFAAIVEELAGSSEANAKIKCGQNLFRWAETEANFPLRTVRDRFLTHGSYHILSNRRVIGWHPDFSPRKKKEGE
jgi:hypothetical protein